MRKLIESSIDYHARSLSRLRWTVALGLPLLCAVANNFLGLGLPYFPAVIFLTAIALTEIVLRLWRPTFSKHLMITADVLIWTMLLYFYGGYSNPFSMVYLVYVTLAAFFLGSAWTWGIFILSSLCFGSLFFWYMPAGAFGSHHSHHMTGGDYHLQGMLVAFILIGSLISIFVTKMSTELERLREREFSEDKLSALATLTAGAAHELATPLATVFLIADELQAARHKLLPISEFKEDIESLQQQMARAKDVLTRMRSRSPETPAEPETVVSVSSIFKVVLNRFSQKEREKIRILSSGEDYMLTARIYSLEEALVALVKNAIEASSYEGSVELSCSRTSSGVQLTVRDFAPTILPEVFRKMGEPFFTTKAPGRGMGLGLYLAKAFASQASGKLEFEQMRPGLAVRLILPV